MRLIDADAFDCLAWQDGEHGTTFDDGVLWVLSKIDEQPTIEERKKGKWIKLYTNNYKCSECGAWWKCDDNEMVEFKFCPNCGADNREESNG